MTCYDRLAIPIKAQNGSQRTYSASFTVALCHGHYVEVSGTRLILRQARCLALTANWASPFSNDLALGPVFTQR